MKRLKSNKLLCMGKACHSVYEPREVIDRQKDYRLWVVS